MSQRKRGLGKGLSELGVAALLKDIDKTVRATEDAPSTPTAPSQPTPAAKVSTDASLKHIAIESIQRCPYQPRRHFDQAALEELAQSIRAQGIIQPIVVRPLGNQEYELVAGERRWRAAQLAGLTEIPAVIKEIGDEAAMAVALVENIQRQALNAIEEAEALQRLIDEFQMTHQEVSEAVGKSRTAVSNLLRLLNLSHDVKAMLSAGEIDMGHARALLALDVHQQNKLAQQIKNLGLSVRQAEHMVKMALSPQRSANKVSQDPDVKRLENSLSDRLHAKVQIQHDNKGKGKLIIHFHSHDELDGILGKL